MAWDEAQQSLIRRFHDRCVAGTSDPINVVIVLVDDNGRVAFGEMEKCTSNLNVLPSMPEDIFRIAYTIGRLTAWEDVIAKHAPTTPSPSPLKMHAVFDGVLYSDGEDTEFEALQFLGKLVLKFVASISMYCKHGSDTVQQLESRVQELTDPARLAIMMHKNMLPLATRDVADAATAAHMVAGLIGAQFTDSDFFSVIQLWTWLAGEDEFGVAVQYLHGTTKYKGRTPTYTEMWERREGDVRVLRVVYAEHGEVFYRWAGAGPEELRPGGQNPDWCLLAWDYSLRTFRSPQLLDRDGLQCVLPNKMANWLQGATMASLTAIKHTEKTPAPLRLQVREVREEVTSVSGGDSGEGGASVLHVFYEGHGWFRYRRCAEGGLGFEAKGDSDEWRPVGYSELWKGLLSVLITHSLENRQVHCLLPKIVTSWILEKKCLAEALPQYKTASGATAGDVITEEGAAEWATEEALKYTCKAAPCDFGKVFVAKACEDMTIPPQKM